MNSRKTTFWAIAALLVLNWVLYLKDFSLSNKQERLQRQIASIERTTAEINATLPSLRELSRKLISQAPYELVPADNEQQWCSKLIPIMQNGFKSTFKVARPKIPLGMNLPRNVRQVDSHVHPGIIPFRLQIKFAGSLNQICRFFSEIDWVKPGMIITFLEVNTTDSKDIYQGNAILTFPTIYYPEDLQQIHRFIQMDDS
jgi:hypothetical protein